jgi:hypothetical protein
MDWIYNNWLTLLGGGSLSGIIGWFLGGKQAKAQEIKKGDVEIDSAEIDYAVKVRELYESLLEQANKDKDALKLDKDAIIEEFKSEKEYFRGQIDDLRKQAAVMQEQFNSIQLAYAKEVEQSQNWEKLHRELLEKYNDLESKYNKLKDDFDKHKKQTQ